MSQYWVMGIERENKRKKLLLEKEKTYLGHVESLRAIAALIVMVFHFISFHDAEGPLIESEAARRYSELGAQGVELFYVISGFVIYYSLTNVSFGFKEYPKYFLKRVARIFPPFLGVILGSCLVPFIFRWPFPYSLNQLAQNATLTVDLFRNTSWMNPIFVTLKVEFLFYIIIGLLVIPMSKVVWSYAVIMFSALIATYYFHSIDLVHNTPFFLIGIACSEIYKTRNMILNYVILAACFSFLYVVFPLEDVLISLIGVVFLLWVIIKSNWLEQIGKFSYSLYLTHGLSGGLFLYYAMNQTRVDWNPSVYVLIAVILSLGFAYLYSLIIEKRAISWSKRIRYDGSKGPKSSGDSKS